MKRLDETLVNKGLVSTRSQAENYIKLGKVRVDGKLVTKAGKLVGESQEFKLVTNQYVSRAGLKLESVAARLGLDFAHKSVLDVGSSTGGFTDYALRHGASRVIGVDTGTDQMHPSLRANPKLELYEKTDIRAFELSKPTDIILIDVSFISLREVLPKVWQLAGVDTQIVAMLKPQFEAGPADVNRGVIKNDTLRRKIIKDFEGWIKNKFIVIAKADSDVTGAKGNKERFYLLKRAA